jgi:hypothetical protein
MNHLRSSLIIFLLVGVTLSVFVEGGSKRRRGTAGAQELMIPVGSQAIALSGAAVASITGIEAAEWNIAGMAEMQNTGEAMFTHATWLGDIGVNYAAVASTFGGRNIFGISLRSLSFGDIMVTTPENPDGFGETYSPNFLTLGFLYARRMTDRIRFGSDFRIVNESIMHTSASGFVVDAGVQYSMKDSGFKIGASLRNLGLTMRFDGSDLEEFHPPGGSEPGTPPEPRRISLQEFEMPTTFELGVAYGPVDMGPVAVTLSGSFLNNNFSFDEYRFGVAANFLKVLDFWAGTSYGYDPEPYGVDNIEDTPDDAQDNQWDQQNEEFIWGPSFGFGLDLSRFTGIGLSVDYAYRATDIFDGVSWLTFKVTF